MLTQHEVQRWVESIDEESTQPEQIETELAEAWQIVFGRSLEDEDADMRRDAWTLLCAEVL